MDGGIGRFEDAPPKIEISKKIRYQTDKLTQKLRDHSSRERRWRLLRTVFPAHLDAITSIRSLGDAVITGSYNGEVSLWSVGGAGRGEGVANSLNTAYKAAVLSMDVSKEVVVGGLGDGQVFVATCGTRGERPEWRKAGAIGADRDPLTGVVMQGPSRCVACSLGGKALCVDVAAERVVSSVQSRTPLKCLDRFSEAVPAFANSVVYAGVSGSVSVWDTRTGAEEVAVITKPLVHACALRTLPETATMMSTLPAVYLSTNDNYIKCHDLRKPTQPLYKALTSTRVTWLDISETPIPGPSKTQPRTLVAASQTNSKAKLFSLDCEQISVCETEPERGALLCCAFVGRDYLAVGGVDRTLYVYGRRGGEG